MVIEEFHRRGYCRFSLPYSDNTLTLISIFGIYSAEEKANHRIMEQGIVECYMVNDDDTITVWSDNLSLLQLLKEGENDGIN